METAVKIKVRNLWIQVQVTANPGNIHSGYPEYTITSITGPSGQGKSSFLTVLNRLYENMEGARVQGEVKIDFGHGFEDILQAGLLPAAAQKTGGHGLSDAQSSACQHF